MVKIYLKSWVAYPQTPHKNLITLAEYIFRFNKYGDVQRRKRVFNLRGHNTLRGLKYFYIFFLKVWLNLLTTLPTALLLFDHCWTSVHWIQIQWINLTSGLLSHIGKLQAVLVRHNNFLEGFQIQPPTPHYRLSN